MEHGQAPCTLYSSNVLGPASQQSAETADQEHDGTPVFEPDRRRAEAYRRNHWGVNWQGLPDGPLAAP